MRPTRSLTASMSRDSDSRNCKRGPSTSEPERILPYTPGLGKGVSRGALASPLRPADDLLAHVGDVARARFAGAVAVGRARAARAARADDARRPREGVLDPGDVQ